MNKEFEIPELKNSEFIGMDPGEIPSLLYSQFSIVQKLTAKRVLDLIRSRKNIKDVDCQTTAEFVDVSAHEEQKKNIEKLQLQLQTSFKSIERYKDTFGSKAETFEKLENEKNALAIEANRLKKEIENISASLDKAHYEMQKSHAENENLRKEGENLTKERYAMSHNLNLLEKTSQELKIMADKYEKSLKEKEERIKILEKQNAKKMNKKIPNEDEEIKPKPALKFDEKEFMDSIRTSSKSKKKNKKDYESPEKQEKTTNDQYFNKESTKLQKLSNQTTENNLSNSTSTVSSISSTHSKKKKTQQKLKINLNQIDEVDSPAHKDYQSSEDSFPDINKPSKREPSPYKKSRGKSRESNTERGQIPEKSRQNKTKNSSNFLNPLNEENSYNSRSEYESSEEYSSTNQISYSKKVRKSKASNSELSDDSYVEDHTITMMNKIIGTEDLSFINVEINSVSIQYNDRVPEREENSATNGVYILPYNPNQFYGLRGDNYYHTTHSVFHAQPRIPDIKDSYFFQSPYHTKNNL